MSRDNIIESHTFVLAQDNIDTDQIIPGHFLTTTEREGLGRFCFNGWRHSNSFRESAGHAKRRDFSCWTSRKRR